MTDVLTSQWEDQRACRGTDPGLFFPAASESGTRAKVEALCTACPVRTECLETAYALGQVGTYGWWAGFSHRDRIDARRLIARGGLTITEAIAELDRQYATGQRGSGRRRLRRNTSTTTTSRSPE